MAEYKFSIVVTRGDFPKGDIDACVEWGLDIAEALALRLNGVPDLEVDGHTDGLELGFYRDAESLSAAMASAIADIEAVGLRPLSASFEPATSLAAAS